MEPIQAEDKPLFGSVPSNLFRIFSGQARHLYAELLTSLAEDLFGHAGEVATRKRVFDAISEFIDRRGRAEVVAVLSSERAGPALASSYVAVYNRLLETGWLVEYRDRYRRVVDFDPVARLVLHTLLDIQHGRVRSYGGAVLNVLTLLQSVEAAPFDKALNVREAALASRGFMNHLRTVAGTMRRVEGLIMAQPTAAALVRRFVDKFITAEIVQDYRNLHARESPYRFRGQIVEVGERLWNDDRALSVIAQGWVAGGVARDVMGAREPIIADLRDVAHVFAGIDDHVRDIETTTFRIERRMTNVVRFSDRMATVSTDRILQALEMLRRAALADDAEVEVQTEFQLGTAPLSPAQFYSPPRRRGDAPEREVEVRPPDPALLRYLAAVDDFELRVSITPERLERYVETTLGDADEIEAAAFPVTDVEQFLLFERLHEAAFGPLSALYEIDAAPGVIVNDWIERQAFVLRRRSGTHG